MTTAIALANVAIATPGLVTGAVKPPAELLALLRMWLAMATLLVAMSKLSTCLEQNDRGEDAATLRQEQQRLREQIEELKSRVH